MPLDPHLRDIVIVKLRFSRGLLNAAWTSREWYRAVHGGPVDPRGLMFGDAHGIHWRAGLLLSTAPRDESGYHVSSAPGLTLDGLRSAGRWYRASHRYGRLTVDRGRRVEFCHAVLELADVSELDLCYCSAETVLRFLRRFADVTMVRVMLDASVAFDLLADPDSPGAGGAAAWYRGAVAAGLADTQRDTFRATVPRRDHLRLESRRRLPPVDLEPLLGRVSGRLRVLSLNGTGWVPGSLDAPRLRELELDGSRVTTDQLLAVLRRHPRLERVSLRHVRDLDFASVHAALQSLEHLRHVAWDGPVVTLPQARPALALTTGEAWQCAAPSGAPRPGAVRNQSARPHSQRPAIAGPTGPGSYTDGYRDGWEAAWKLAWPMASAAAQSPAPAQSPAQSPAPPAPAPPATAPSVYAPPARAAARAAAAPVPRWNVPESAPVETPMGRIVAVSGDAPMGPERSATDLYRPGRRQARVDRDVMEWAVDEPAGSLDDLVAAQLRARGAAPAADAMLDGTLPAAPSSQTLQLGLDDAVVRRRAGRRQIDQQARARLPSTAPLTRPFDTDAPEGGPMI